MTQPDLRQIVAVLEAEAYRLRVLADYDLNHNSLVKTIQENAVSHMRDMKEGGTFDAGVFPDHRFIDAMAKGGFDIPSHSGMQFPKSHDGLTVYARALTLLVGEEAFHLRYRAEDYPSGGYSFDRWIHDDRETSDFLRRYPDTAEILQQVLEGRCFDHYKAPSALGEVHGAALQALVSQHIVEREFARLQADRDRKTPQDEGPGL